MASLWPYFLAKIGCFLELFYFCDDGRKLRREDLWEKWQANSLTFWLKLVVFGHIMISSGDEELLKRVDFPQNRKLVGEDKGIF